MPSSGFCVSSAKRVSPAGTTAISRAGKASAATGALDAKDSRIDAPIASASSAVTFPMTRPSTCAAPVHAARANRVSASGSIASSAAIFDASDASRRFRSWCSSERAWRPGFKP